MNTYIGQKGYSILKKELTNEQIATLKAELFVRPYTPGAPVNNATGFKVYRESVSKYYVPRYFGEATFGKAKEHKISGGDDIESSSGDDENMGDEVSE